MSQSKIDKYFSIFLKSVVISTSAIILLIAVFIARDGAGNGNLGVFEISRFVQDKGWFPTENNFNVVPMFLSSLALMLGAVIVASPIGIGIAVFVNEYAGSRLGMVINRILEIAASTPSIVFGLWGLVVLVPIFTGFDSQGASLLAGIIVLSIMILPTIAIMSDSAIKSVNQQQKVTAISLGLRKRQVIFCVILKLARPGLYSAVVLACARAVGETMAVLMVSGNAINLPDSLLTSVRAVTSNIALEMPYAVGDHRAALFVSVFYLFMFVVLMVLVNSIILRRNQRFRDA